MNKINTTSIIVAASIIGLVLLSGCLGNDTTKTTPLPTSTPVITQPAPSTTPVTVITYNASDNASKNSGHATESIKSSNMSTNSSALVPAGSDWCKPGASFLKDAKGFTVQGLTTDNNGTSLCYAKSVDSKTNTTISYYFSQDKKIERMNSTSISANGSASASASSSIS